ncbi:hypothetical protein [Rickettsiales endosymbiont of Stachyamoeba lipophora]|uniref:hypothetical protein n=1 Tax=Rickettsiales endosymbiont of Stachyamoeba lipophora TaxID=2486578 RepID=UPI000F654D30|nr:hypothetical protein [Rickettsiales endosymbiont of Stachyamoeba lipophora]AZL15783.1 hypothetical protein EF513_04385 [Rickettsiales endosymbiont of Stachyamoeba lipophora]
MSSSSNGNRFNNRTINNLADYAYENAKYYNSGEKGFSELLFSVMQPELSPKLQNDLFEIKNYTHSSRVGLVLETLERHPDLYNMVENKQQFKTAFLANIPESDIANVASRLDQAFAPREKQQAQAARQKGTSDLENNLEMGSTPGKDPNTVTKNISPQQQSLQPKQDVQPKLKYASAQQQVKDVATKAGKTVGRIASDVEKEVSSQFTRQGGMSVPSQTLRAHANIVKLVGTGVGTLNNGLTDTITAVAKNIKDKHPNISAGLETAAKLNKNLGKVGQAALKATEYVSRGAALVMDIVNSPVYYTVDKWPEAMTNICNTFFDRLEQMLGEMEKKGPSNVTPPTEKEMRDLDVLDTSRAMVVSPPNIPDGTGQNVSPDNTPKVDQGQQLEIGGQGGGYGRG